MTFLIIIILVTLVVSFICSLSEAVLYSVPITTVEEMASRGKAGTLFRRFKKDIQRPIAAIVGLNTIANTAGAALAGAAFVALYGEHWLMAFTLALTGAVLFFSEIVPKTLGAVFSKPLAPWVAWPIQVLIWFMAPLVFLIQKTMGLLLPRSKPAFITAQEIITLAGLSRKEGSIAFQEEKIIENVLQLQHRKAMDVMTPRTVVFSLDADLSIEESRQVGSGWPHSRVPLYKESPENIVGFVMRRDVFNLLSDGKKEVKLSELARPMHFVPAMVRLDKLLLTFLERRQHLFAVVDEYGGFSGVVSLEDVLEEIIGREIIGEFDTAIDMSELARKRRKQGMGYSS